MRCSICDRKLNRKNDPTTKNCGGDCLRCMAEVAKDPDAIKAMEQLKGDGYDAKRNLQAR